MTMSETKTDIPYGPEEMQVGGLGVFITKKVILLEPLNQFVNLYTRVFNDLMVFCEFCP